MGQKMWPVLKSCKRQCYEAKDRLSQLPDEIMLLIMSFLNMKEAAGTSVLSHRWNCLWRWSPILIFEDFCAMTRMSESAKCIPQERSKFYRWVNGVLKAHLGQTIDELRVTFDFDSRHQSAVNRWVFFAIEKEVKRLELNFSPASFPSHSPPKLLRSLKEPRNLGAFKTCLRSLCLKYVNVTAETIECLLKSCVVLENLCINHSPSLGYIKARSPQLKHFEIGDCESLGIVDILAPKLLSFTYLGIPIHLHIRNASLLSKVSVYKCWHHEDVEYAFESLSKYFTQLEYLCWDMILEGDDKLNLCLKNPPIMANLNHLELHVDGRCEESLMGWADLIEASPLLQRLTVKFLWSDGYPCGNIVKRNGKSLKSLKILEYSGNLGISAELEFITYVIENSIMLEDVIVEFRPLGYFLEKHRYPLADHFVVLKRILPQGVKLTSKALPKSLF